MNKKSVVSSILNKSRITQLLDKFWGQDRLTVLGYHRIIDLDVPGFDHYRPNVSASPAMFERQLAYVVKHFNVIDLARLNAFIQHGEPLPKKPLLITFDDGYIDNYTNAYPILGRYNLSAVMFLITGKMGSSMLPWWDTCAYYFYHTHQQNAVLPSLGERDLSTLAARNLAREALILELKRLPENQKQKALAELGNSLNVAANQDTPLFITWDQARELIRNGIACQPHTVDHPILRRIAPEEGLYQLCESCTRIESETRQAATAFAYPNGTTADFNDSTVA